MLPLAIFAPAGTQSARMESKGGTENDRLQRELARPTDELFALIAHHRAGRAANVARE